MTEHYENLDALQEKLAEILIKGSLYRIFVYTQANCHLVTEDRFSPSRFSILPKSLKMYCSHSDCDFETQWVTSNPLKHFAGNAIMHSDYVCNNCQDNQFRYYYILRENKSDN